MTQQKLSIDSSEAQKAVDDLAAATERYNKVARRQVKVAKQQTDVAFDLAKKQKGLRREAALLAALMRRVLAEKKKDAEDLKKKKKIVDDLTKAQIKQRKEEEKAARAADAARKKMEKQRAGLIAAGSRQQYKLAKAAAKEAEKQFRRTQQAAMDSGRAIANAFRSVQQFTIFGGLLALQSALRASISDARELDRAISELKTISANTQQTMGEWAVVLRNVSNSFGVNALEVAEAAYQVLSNQVIKATNAMEEMSQVQEFLMESNKLATISVGTLDDAVSATTSVINAFGYSSNEAARINAILFQTIEQGRTRLNEFANSLGRVSVLSNQLGVSLLEQNTALSFLTRQGMNMSEAMTLLRNVELRLLKPTEAMKDLFEGWGFTSGQAAVRSLGLVNVLAMLAQKARESGDEAAELATIYGRLRTIVGGAALSTKEFAKEMDRFKGAGVKAANALEMRMKSLDKRLEIMSKEAKNYFIEIFGTPVIKNIVRFVENAGGATDALDGLFIALKTVAAAVASYVIVLHGYNIAMMLFAARTRDAMGMVTKSTKSVAILKALFFGFNPIMLAAAAAAAGVAYAFMTMKSEAAKLDEALAKAKERAAGLSEAFRQSSKSHVDSAMVDQQIEFEKQSMASAQAYSRFIAVIERGNMRIRGSFASTFDAIKKSISTAMDHAVRTTGKRLDTLIRNAESSMDRARGLADTAATGRRTLMTNRTLSKLENTAGDAKTVSPQYEAAIRQSRQQEQNALNNMDDRAYRDYTANTDRLINAYRDRLKKIQAESEKLVGSRTRAFDPLTGRQRIVTKKRPTNAGEALVAKKQLFKIEKDIAQVQANRLTELEKHAALETKRNAQKLVDLKKQEAALEKFQTLVAQIDSFEGSDKGVLRGLLKSAGAEARVAGVDAGSQAQLLAKGNALLLQIQRKADADKSSALTKSANEQYQILIEHQKKMNSKIADAAKEDAKERQKAHDAAIKEYTKYIEQLKLLKGKGLYTADYVKLTPGLIDVEIDKLEGRITELTRSMKAGPDVFNRSLNESLDVLAAVNKKFGELKTAHGNLFGLLGNSYTPSKSKVINNLIPLAVAIDDYQKALSKPGLIEAEGRLKVSIDKAKDAMDRLAKTFPEYARQAENGWTVQTVAAQDYNTVLNSIIRKLSQAAAIRKKLDKGNGKGFAFGGRVGFDHQPAMLREGETVMNPMATRRFGPTLDAMNSGNTTNINVGGINVTGGGGANDPRAIANMVIAQLQQMQRLNQM